MARYDTAVINGTLVVPYSGTSTLDIGIRDGKIVALSDRIAPDDAERVIDAKGQVVLPGAVDSHSDADLAIVDLATEREVTTELLLSAQDFTPFEGLLVKGWPTHTNLRGQPMFDDGEVVGEQIRRYIRRPVALHSQSQ